jgi:hypothetical protein
MSVNRFLYCILTYIPRSGITGSYRSSVFSFLGNLHSVFHGDYTNIHFHQQCIGFFFPHILTISFLYVDFVSCYLAEGVYDV